MKIRKLATSISVVFYTNIYATNQAMRSLSTINNIIQKVCFISGISVLFCAIMKYFSYKKNPIAVPISQPIWLFIIGFCLIGLAYLPSPMD